MIPKGFLVERYDKHNSIWVNHKFTTSVSAAKASITQAKKRWYKVHDFRIIELVSNEEEIPQKK